MNVSGYAMMLFSEQVLRGTLFFNLSMFMRKIDPFIREAANLGNLLTISPGIDNSADGVIQYVPKLEDVMFEKFSEKTILIVDEVSGNEEVPDNVSAIVMLNSRDYPDVLAHVSVRARNLKVFMGILFDEETCEKLRRMGGNTVKIDVSTLGGLEWEVIEIDKDEKVEETE